MHSSISRLTLGYVNKSNSRPQRNSGGRWTINEMRENSRTPDLRAETYRTDSFLSLSVILSSYASNEIRPLNIRSKIFNIFYLSEAFNDI